MKIFAKRPYNATTALILVFVLIGSLHLTFPKPTAAGATTDLLDKWLERQAQIRAWSADVVQHRKLKSLVHPLTSEGRVWFRQPNQFRWQLGDPPRTIAVRSAEELMVIYPKLRQAERYPVSGISDPAWKQVLTLLEVGFPSTKEAFYSRYKIVSANQVDKTLHFELQPLASAARRLLEKIRLEVSAQEFHLLATELVFPDGSIMRNQFSQHRLNPSLDDALFRFDIDEDYQVVEPLKR